MKPVAMITGGQQGIGLGVAKTLADSGFEIVMVSEREESDDMVLRALQQLGDKARYFQHDLAKVENCADLLDQIGHVDCLISNAGVPAKIRGDLLSMQTNSWDFVMDINLRGTFFLAQEVAKRMLASSSSHYRSMVFVTSISATHASVERGEYCISKAGASMMAKLFSLRLAEENIGVFEVRPGIVQTEMTAGVSDRYDPLIKGGLVPQKRWGNPDDVAKVILPMVRGDMAFASGSVVNVDGALGVLKL